MIIRCCLPSFDFRNHVGAVLGASHDAVQFAHAGQNHGSARLQASNAPRMMRVWHASIVGDGK